MEGGCIVVTGASRGIGAGIALELAGRGYTVVCLSRSGNLPGENDKPAEVAPRLKAVRCDVTESASLAAAFGSLRTLTDEPVVGLVNNAGIHLQGASASFSRADYEHVMASNATSVLLACQAAYPHLSASPASLIVNIGSFYDKIGVKQNLAYCASKAAVGAMTRCLAVEWAKQGIRVLNVAPGYIVTDLNRDEILSGPLATFLQKRIPVGNPGSVGEVSALVAALFGLPGKFMTGETLYLDGGQGMAL